MTFTQPSTERLLPVRLDRIRPDVRWAAAHEYPGDGAVLHAALFPSQITYWVSWEAATQLRSIAA